MANNPKGLGKGLAALLRVFPSVSRSHFTLAFLSITPIFCRYCISFSNNYNPHSCFN